MVKLFINARLNMQHIVWCFGFNRGYRSIIKQALIISYNLKRCRAIFPFRQSAAVFIPVEFHVPAPCPIVKESVSKVAVAVIKTIGFIFIISLVEFCVEKVSINISAADKPNSDIYPWRNAQKIQTYIVFIFICGVTVMRFL